MNPIEVQWLSHYMWLVQRAAMEPGTLLSRSPEAGFCSSIRDSIDDESGVLVMDAEKWGRLRHALQNSPQDNESKADADMREAFFNALRGED